MFVLIDNKEDLKANININRLKTEEISQTMKKIFFFCIYKPFLISVGTWTSHLYLSVVSVPQ